MVDIIGLKQADEIDWFGLAGMGPALSDEARPNAKQRKREGSAITEEIRRVLEKYARLVVDVADLNDDDDLFRLGMTSHASVSVMLALEDAFGVEFPEQMLRKSTFESIDSIRRSLTELLGTSARD